MKNGSCPAAAEFKISAVSSIATIGPARWDACANPGAFETACDPGQTERYNPFLSAAFLGALEESGCVGRRSGWQPAHVIVEDEAGELLAAAPAYLKSHSQGEYVFDHGWADAYERAGGSYYPKVQVSVPFTPVTGRRLLVKPDGKAAFAGQALREGLEGLRRGVEASSVHATFLTKPEWDELGAEGWLQRNDQQFHFDNPGYADFEAFLAALASRKRKMIRRERKDALAPGISVEWITGSAITEAHWDAFFAFYMDTGSRKWGRPYLNRKFFSLIGERMADRILLVMAKRAGHYIAGAINFIGDDALYGRNWGAIEEHPFLHFEVCYYQAIDYAITTKLKRVEAGAQGEHKLARGYRAVPTYSAHKIADPRLARAVDDYLQHERAHVADAIAAYGDLAPYRQVEQDV